jgi:hypothetical protein
MRDDRFAESILGLVAAPDRAAAAIGDLMEELPRYGRIWFWRATLRTAAGCVWSDVTSLPIRMAWAAFIGWFGYMLLAVILLLVGYVLENAAWAVLHVLTHHTGFELLSDAFRLRFEWPPLPHSVHVFSEAAVMMAIAPFYVGQIVAIEWKEKAVAFTLMLTLVWSVLLTVLPFKGMFGDRVSLEMLPVISAFLFVGVVKMRRTQIFTA